MNNLFGRVFTVTGNFTSSVDTLLSQLTITGDTAGAGGGGIAVDGGGFLSPTLTVADSILTNNKSFEGGALRSENATLVIINTTIADNQSTINGGALFASDGTSTITRSLIARNQSHGSGGGLFLSSGTHTLTNVTLSNNAAAMDGGGIYSTSILNLVNSTLTSNQADGGGMPGQNDGIGNGGGIFNAGTVEALNTIIAGNFDTTNNAGSGSIHPDVSGAVVSRGTNLIGNTAGSSGFGAADLTNVEALLSALGSFGGATETHALLPGSPAINAGQTGVVSGLTVPGTDQRGIVRPAAVDIGAFESRGFAIFVDSGNNQRTLVNTGFDNQLVVLLTSAFSEPVAGGKVTFTSIPALNGASAAIGTGNPATVAPDGTAQVNATANATGSAAGTPYAIEAAARGATLFSFSLTNQVVSSLAFQQQPTDTIAGHIINQSLGGVTVALLDQDGLAVPKATHAVAIVASGAGLASGTTPRFAVAGVATFNDLIITTVADSYTLTVSLAASPAVPAGISDIFNIVSGTLVVTSVTANRAFPVPPGTPITFTATASGVVPPVQYRFFLYTVGVGWVELQAYSTSNQISWTPTSGQQGTHQVQVWVRIAGSSAGWEAFGDSAFFSVDNTSPINVVSLTANQTFPLPAGTTITWTALASGGSAPLQYQFYRYDLTTATWSIVQSYSSSHIFTSTPGPAQAGPQKIQVWVRSTGSSAALEASADSPLFTITTATLTVSAVTITGATQTASPMTFTARARGGVEPAQFRFYLRHSTGTFSLLQDWSTARSVVWTFTSTGAFRVQAHGRNGGSTGGADSYADSAEFTVTAGPIDAVVTADRGFPAATGTVIRWTATATGGNALLEYKFWRYKVSTGLWTMVQDYSGSGFFTWTPGPADQGTYSIQVWVRSSGSAASFDGFASSGYFGIDNTFPLGGVVLEPTPALPQFAFRPMNWRGKATGGDAPLEYRLWFKGSGGWVPLNMYTTVAPGLAMAGRPAGTYVIQLWVRRVGSTASYEAYASTGDIVVQEPTVTTTLTGNYSGSLPAGTPVTVRASSTDAQFGYEYKFYRHSSVTSSWTLVQDWSPTETYSQTLPSAPGNYIIQVYTRRSGSLVDAAIAFANFYYTITP